MISEYLARIAVTGVKSSLRPKLSLFDESRLPMRVWPTDIDMNGHINNGRYLTLMDLGRWDLSIRGGLLGPFLKKRWWPVLGGATVRFRRELRVGWSYELVSKLACLDEKWLYFDQRFVREGDLYAVGFVKAVVRRGKTVIPPKEALADFGGDRSPEPSDELAKWISTQQRDRSAS